MIPSAQAVQRLNSYEATGQHSHAPGERLDALIIEHLDTQRRLRRMEQAGQIMRLAVEGYDIAEIASRLQVTEHIVRSRLAWIRECIFRPRLYFPSRIKSPAPTQLLTRHRIDGGM